MAIVLDNAIDKGFVDMVYKTVIDDPFPWHFIRESAYRPANPRSGQFSFASLIYHHGQVHSEDFKMFDMVIRQSLDALDTPIQKLLRVRLGLILKYDKFVIHDPHVDLFHPHKTLLVYLNDSDGPTVLYDQFAEDGREITGTDGLTIQQEIEPVQGRVALFDGLQYHSSTTPIKNDIRVVMNVNFI